MEKSVRPLAQLCAILLAVAAFWNARAVLGFEFIARDDDINIYYNPHLGPPGPQSTKWMFSDAAYMRRYVPLGWLSFAAVYQFSGLSPVGYHAANLALHVGNSLLVYAILLVLLRRYQPNTDSRSQIAVALVGAAIWSLHPFRAETIGWASGLLYGAAGFWALSSVVAYAIADGLALSSKRTAWLVSAWLAYALSILTYPVTIALPVTFVAMDLAPRTMNDRRPLLRRLLVEKLGFLLPGAAVLVFTIFARYETSSFWPPPPTWEEFTPVQRFAQSMAVWAHYLWRTWWPVNLEPAPTWLFEIKPLAPRFALSVLAILGITLVVSLKRQWRPAALIWAAYLGILVPLLGLTEHPHFPSDRYAYLASVIVVFAAALAAVRLPSRGRRILLGVGLAMIVGCGWIQRRQLRIWQNTDALLTYELLSRPSKRTGDLEFITDNFRKWATFHAYRGEFARARQILALGERRAPRHPRIIALKSELEGVEADAAMSNHQDPGPAAAQLHAKMAMDFSRSGRRREANDHFRAARSLSPASKTIAYNWAVFSALDGKPFRALELFNRSIGGAPEFEVASDAKGRLLKLMADSFATIGRHDLAADALEMAKRFSRSGTLSRNTESWNPSPRLGRSID